MSKEIESILLIMPPFSMKERYGRGIEKIGASLPPLGLLYVGAALEKAGYNVKIFDTQIYNWNIKEIVQHCDDFKPDAVGVYCNTSNYQRAVELAQEIKTGFAFNIPIIFGGPHVTIRPLEVLSNDAIDYVVIGEGEISSVELIDVLNNRYPGLKLGDVKGIGFKEGGKPTINPFRALIENLDLIPFPARHLVPMEKYRPSPNQYKRFPMTTMMVSRGCPFNCTFCNVEKLWTRRYRIRSVKNVVDEIKHLIKNYGIREINFWDDIWGLNKEWIKEFCDAIKKEKLNLTWSCECRVDTIDKEILKKMKEAGCWCIFFGIESLDQEILEAINKKITIEKITQAFVWMREAGIEIRANFILGLPKETPEKVRKMLEILCQLNPDYVKFNLLTPYPETALYKEIKEGKWGVMVDESYDKLTGYFATFLPCGYKDIDELKRIKKYAFRKYYFRLGYILPKLLSIRSFEDAKRYLKGALALISM